MDPELNFRFNDLDRQIVAMNDRIEQQSKRFEDVKWVAGSVGLIISALIVVAGWNAVDDRDKLTEFEKSIKEEFSSVDETTLQLQSIPGIDIAGQEIPTVVQKGSYVDKTFRPSPDGDLYLIFNFILKNIGDSSSGQIFIKVYSNNLLLGGNSTDEPGYKYEAYFDASRVDLNIPGKLSTNEEAEVEIYNKTWLPPGRYPILLKIYYGKGKVLTEPVILKVGP